MKVHPERSLQLARLEHVPVVGDVVEARAVGQPAHIRVIARARAEPQLDEVAAEVGPAHEPDFGIEVGFDDVAVERRFYSPRLRVKYARQALGRCKLPAPKRPLPTRQDELAPAACSESLIG